MSNAMCAICQLEFTECKDCSPKKCLCKELFKCCNNSFHKSCIKKLYDSKIISQIMRITKCPLCRTYIDKDTKDCLTNEQYLEELEESIIDYDIQVMNYKEKNDISNEEHKKLIDLCDNIMENNNQRMLDMIELHAKDMEEMKQSRDKISNNLKKAISSMRILLNDAKENQIQITMLEAEKKGLEDCIYKNIQKNQIENKIISKLTTLQIDKESQTDHRNDKNYSGIAC